MCVVSKSIAETSEESVDDQSVAGRIRRFGLSGDVSHLWPGVTHDALTRACAEIEALVRVTLSDDAAISPALGLSCGTSERARVMGCAAFVTGTGPLLGFWIEQGRVVADAPLRALLVQHLEENRRFAARIESGVSPVLEAFSRRGIVPMVIKGNHTARAYWADPGIRPTADLDLVIDPLHVADAETALADLGFRPKDAPSSNPYKRDWLPPGAVATHVAIDRPDRQNPWQIDLHVSLDQDFKHGARARLDRIRDRTEAMEFAGHRVLVPAQPLTLLLLASHASRHLNSMRLFRTVELIEVLRRDLARGRLDWSEVLASLRTTDAARYSFPLLQMAETLVPGLVDRGVLEYCERASSWAVRDTVRRMIPSGISFHRETLLREFMWARDAGDLARRAVARVLARDTLPVGARWWRLLRRTFTGFMRIRAPDERARISWSDASTDPK